MPLPNLQVLDVISTRSTHGALPWAIRWSTQAWGEKPSVFHHSALVSWAGKFGMAGEWELSRMMEAQRVFQEIPVTDGLRRWGSFRIDRYKRLDLPLAMETVRRHKHRIGQAYPKWKLGLMFADRLRAKVPLVGRFARAQWAWLGELDPRVVCSAWDATAFLPQGENFGKPTPHDVDPDDIVDWIDAHPEDWESVVPLTPDLSER